MFYVYILASRSRNAIYVGSTEDLARRVDQHRAGAVRAHTKRYAIQLLVWFEGHDSREAALLRERRLKRWPRRWKDELIGAMNPGWQDISDRIPH